MSNCVNFTMGNKSCFSVELYTNIENYIIDMIHSYLTSTNKIIVESYYYNITVIEVKNYTYNVTVNNKKFTNIKGKKKMITLLKNKLTR